MRTKKWTFPAGARVPRWLVETGTGAALEPSSSAADRPQDAVAEASSHSPVDSETTGSVQAR